MEKQFKTLPRGLEVLITKAAVDPEFRALLSERRAAAADEIELSLSPIESAMLAAIPRGQLEMIIDQTEVSEESRRVFLGKAAAAMLAGLGLGATQGCSWSRGIRSDYPEPPRLGPGSPPVCLGVRPGPLLRYFEPVYFDYDLASIRADQLAIMDQNLKTALYYADSNKSIRLTGHTDERGTTEYNLALGERRAQAVRDALVRGGVPAERIVTLSKGEEQPADPAHTEAAWTKNRRVEFEVTNE